MFPPLFRSHLRLRTAASAACPPATEGVMFRVHPCPAPCPPCPRQFQKNQRRTRRYRERREEHPFLRPSLLPGVSELISFGERNRAETTDMIPTLYRSRPGSSESTGSTKGPQRAVASRRLKRSIGGLHTTFSLASAVKSSSIDRMPDSHGRRSFKRKSLPYPLSAVPSTVSKENAPNQALQRTPGRASFPSAESAPRRL